MRICPFLHQRKKTVSHRITSQGCRMSTWCLFSSSMVYGGGKEAPPSARRSSPRNLFLPGGWWSCKEISVLSVKPLSGAKWLQHETDELVFHSWQAGCPHYMLKGFPLRTADVSKLEESEQKLPRSRCTRSLGCLERNGSKLTSGEHQPSSGPRGIQSGDLCPLPFRWLLLLPKASTVPGFALRTAILSAFHPRHTDKVQRLSRCTFVFGPLTR